MNSFDLVKKYGVLLQGVASYFEWRKEHSDYSEFGALPAKYLSFVAPAIHTDTRTFLDTVLVQVQSDNKSISIKPYDIASFTQVTKEKKNLTDMEEYSRGVFEDFKKRLANT